MKKITAYSCLILSFIASCKKDADKVPPMVNTPPIAIAGNDTTIYFPNNVVALHGGASYDLESSIVKHSWRVIGSPTTFPVEVEGENVNVYNLYTPGDYEFELTVKDVHGATAQDRFKVTVVDRECTTASKEIVVEDLVWQADEFWGSVWLSVELFNHIPDSGNFKELYIKRAISDEWKKVIPYTTPSDIEIHKFSYIDGIFTISPSNDGWSDSPDIKIVYCDK